MRIALVHEHLASDGGAEKVLLAFQRMFPEAPTYTLFYNRKSANAAFAGKEIRTSFLQSWPFAQRLYKWYLPLMPMAVERFDLRGFDVVLSSASAFAKGVITTPETAHICYCHSPTRYLWTDSLEYVEALPYPRPIRFLIASYLSRLRQWDRLAADRVDTFVANSKTVQQRIKKYYRRESVVVHPPVNVDRFSISKDLGNFYLTGGRLVAYKRFDLTVRAFQRLGLPLKVFGTGPQERFLRSQAAGTIEFLGFVPDHELAILMSRCLAFIHPQEEDFGIAAVEAQACGRPVVAYAKGGALETIQDGVTGAFFDEQSWEALADTVLRLKMKEYDPEKIRSHAVSFSPTRFVERMHSVMQTALDKRNQSAMIQP